MKKALIIVFVLLFSQMIGLGQEKSKSRKMDLSERERNSSIQMDIDSAKYYLTIDHYKSLDFIEHGLKQSFKDKREKNEESAKLYEILGDVYALLEQYDLANKNYHLAIENYSLVPIDLKLKLIENHTKLGNISKAKELLGELDDKQQDNATRLRIYKIKGDLLVKEDKPDSALVIFNKGLELSQREALKTESLPFENRIASIFQQQGEVEQAQQCLEQSFDNTEDLDPNFRIQQAETNAVFYRKNKDLYNEVNVRQQSLEVLNSLDRDAGIQKEIQYQNLQIADAYMEKSDYKKAIPFLEKSVVSDDKLSDLDLEIEATKKLSDAYEKIGRYDKAMVSYRKYVELTDELYKEKEKEINEAVNMTRDLVDKQKRIDGLELDRELSESKEKIYQKDQSIASLNNKKQQWIIYSLLGGLVLALAAIFFFYKNLQQRKMANNLLALKALKSQMNPHFIFNALNSVNNYIALNDERKANKYITDFSKLMRMVLDVSDKDFICLQDEIDLISLYTKLENTRFEDKFDYEIDVDDELKTEELQIAPMLIQPFIENAVWHGLRYKEEKGFLKINFVKINGDRFRIEILDNGVGRERSKQLKSNHQLKKESKGMFNVRERIKIIKDMYGHDIQLHIQDLNKDGSGTKVELIFPFFTTN